MTVAVLTEEQLEHLVERAVERAVARVGRPAPASEELLTLPEAARRLGVSPRTVQRWVAMGQMDAIRVGASRRVRLPAGSSGA